MSPAEVTPPSGMGTLRCEAGTGRDRAIINYTVTNDGRNYKLVTDDEHFFHLEFNNKHAYLIVE